MNAPIPSFPESVQNWLAAWGLASCLATSFGVMAVLLVSRKKPALRSAFLVPVTLLLAVMPLIALASTKLGWRGWEISLAGPPEAPAPASVPVVGWEASPTVMAVESDLPEISAPETPFELPEEASSLGEAPALPASPSPSEATASTSAWLTILQAAGLAWLLGCVVSLFRLGRDQVRLARLGARLPHLREGRVARIWGAVAGPDCSVQLALGPPDASPFAFGFFRPKVAVPSSSLEEHDDRQVAAILAHELAHVRHRDIWLGWAQRLAVALHWWNPLVRILSAALSRDREALCDLAASERVHHPRHYADALLLLAERSANMLPAAGALGIAGSRSALAARLVTLVKHHKDMKTQLHRNYLVRTLLTAVALAGSTLGLRVSFAQQTPPAPGAPSAEAAPPAAVEKPADPFEELPAPPAPPAPPAHAAPPLPPAAPNSDEVAALRQEVRALHEQIATMRREMHGRPSGGAGSFSNSPFAAPSVPLPKILPPDAAGVMKPAGPAKASASSGKRTARQEVEKQAQDLERALRNLLAGIADDDSSRSPREEVEKQVNDLSEAVEEMIHEAAEQAKQEIKRSLDHEQLEKAKTLAREASRRAMDEVRKHMDELRGETGKLKALEKEKRETLKREGKERKRVGKEEIWEGEPKPLPVPEARPTPSLLLPGPKPTTARTI